jgi:SAM-dependent methyltransferase
LAQLFTTSGVEASVQRGHLTDSALKSRFIQATSPYCSHGFSQRPLGIHRDAGGVATPHLQRQQLSLDCYRFAAGGAALMLEKPDAPACARNRDPILNVLRSEFADRKQVLEIGSGTGQHAIYFAAALPHLLWQTSDQREHHTGIRAWLAEAQLSNVLGPLSLNVATDAWPQQHYDAIFTANTLHYMSWPDVEQLFVKLPQVLTTDAKLAVYGPFNYGGQFTSDSNAQFDVWLKQSAPFRGIRDFEAVDALARTAGLQLINDIAMPANNRLLLWQRSG